MAVGRYDSRIGAAQQRPDRNSRGSANTDLIGVTTAVWDNAAHAYTPNTTFRQERSRLAHRPDRAHRRRLTRAVSVLQHACRAHLESQHDTPGTGARVEISPLSIIGKTRSI